MRQLTFFAIITCMLILISCESDNLVNYNDNEVVVGSGTITSESHTLSTFHTVVLEGTGNIRITKGAEQLSSIDADDNIHEYIQMSVTDGILKIKTEQGISFRDVSITYNLTMTDLEKISIVGAGDLLILGNYVADLVTVEVIGAGNINAELTVDTLTTNLVGAGIFTYDGSAYKHKVLLAGAGSISSYSLQTNFTDITLAGTGNIQVTVSQTLKALISGLGNIYYQGTPTIDASITGFGSIVPAN